MSTVSKTSKKPHGEYGILALYLSFILSVVMDFKKVFAFSDRASFITLLVTIALMPLFSLPFLGVANETSKGLLLTGGALLSFLFWIIARCTQDKIIIPRSPVLLLAKIFTLVIVLAALFSESIRTSFWGGAFGMGTASTTILLFLVLFLSTVIF